ncbi:hypothetical protein H0H92_012967, partial [Tricholoma furcatifolium]
SMNVVECPEFRELLLYLGDDTIDDDDIPGRTKITKMIEDEAQSCQDKIKASLK